MEFETDNGVGMVRGDQSMICQCYMVATRGKSLDQAMTAEMNARDPFIYSRPTPREEAVYVRFKDKVPETTTRIGMNLPLTVATQMTDFQ